MYGQVLGRVQCVQCVAGTRPDHESQTCRPCISWPLVPGVKCGCGHQSPCLPDNLELDDIYRETSSQHRIPYTR